MWSLVVMDTGWLDCYRVELKSQYSLLMARKKEIRKVLKDFENEFQAKHGR